MNQAAAVGGQTVIAPHVRRAAYCASDEGEGRAARALLAARPAQQMQQLRLSSLLLLLRPLPRQGFWILRRGPSGGGVREDSRDPSVAAFQGAGDQGAPDAPFFLPEERVKRRLHRHRPRIIVKWTWELNASLP